MDDTYIMKWVLPMNGKEKEWLYYMKYNIKMINNIKMEIINIEGRRKLHILWKEMIHDINYSL